MALRYTCHTPSCLKHLHANIFAFHTALIIPIINIIIKTFTLGLEDKIGPVDVASLEPMLVLARGLRARSVGSVLGDTADIYLYILRWHTRH